MPRKLFHTKRWKTRVNPRNLHRKSWETTQKVERGLESIVDIGLRLGTLVLLIALFVFLYRTLTDQRYVIKAFSVLTHLEENGFTGAVVAGRINDEVRGLKELAASAKAHSLQTAGALEPALAYNMLGRHGPHPAHDRHGCYKQAAPHGALHPISCLSYNPAAPDGAPSPNG